MILRKTLSTLLLFLVMVAPGFNPCVFSGLAAQEKPKNKADKEKPQIVDGSEGHPVLWNEPADVESLDMFYGPGGSEGAPDLTGKFTYVAQDTNGTQKKIYVKDDKEREWTVKF